MKIVTYQFGYPHRAGTHVGNAETETRCTAGRVVLVQVVKTRFTTVTTSAKHILLQYRNRQQNIFMYNKAEASGSGMPEVPFLIFLQKM